MFIIYDLIFLIFAVCYLPVMLLKKKFHKGFTQRLGFITGIPKLDRPIWLHAVSVGEAMSIKHLVESLKQRFPEKNLVISTVTPTGNSIVRGFAGKKDFVIYLPLDLSWVVRRVISRIEPSLFVIAETEIWPNLITCLHEKKIPVIVINGRISDRSFKGYLRVKTLFKPVFNKVSVFCVQSELDAERLARLGVAPEKISVTGNMKFDIEIRDYEELKKDYADYRMKLGLGSKEKLLVAASTHPGEEQEILKVYERVSAVHPDLRLLIAPRHPQRSEEVEKIVGSFSGLSPLRISKLSRSAAGQAGSGSRNVFILDSVGQLMYFYAISDLVFVGGSLVKSGGHNILEPASLGKPIIFGKYMFNFRDIAEMFVKSTAGIMVQDSVELEDKLKLLLDDRNAVSRLGSAGRKIIQMNQGATFRNVEAAARILKGEERAIDGRAGSKL